MTFDREEHLDEIDRGILRELQENARISWSELGRRVGLTPPAVADRVRRLEESGVIVGYRAQVDPARVGLPLTAFVRVSARSAARTELSEVLPNYEEVLEAHRVTGVDCFVMKVAVRDVGHLQEVIDRLMPFGDTVTSIVLSSPVEHRTIEEAEGAQRAPERTTASQAEAAS
jgi:Lrp/AsnC family transcriptional regulator, leucine-responsive regulatory protein